MKINWLNYTHHVPSCLFVTLSILTIFSAEYVVFPTSLLLGCLLIPLLFEQHLFSRRMTWSLSIFFAILAFALLFIIKTNHISLSYPATTLLLFVLASLSFSNSLIQMCIRDRILCLVPYQKGGFIRHGFIVLFFRHSRWDILFGHEFFFLS